MTVTDPFGIIHADVVTPKVIEPGKIVGLGPTGAIRAGRDPIVAEWMRKRVAADLAGRYRRHKRDRTVVWGWGATKQPITYRPWQ